MIVLLKHRNDKKVEIMNNPLEFFLVQKEQTNKIEVYSFDYRIYDQQFYTEMIY